MSVDRVINHKLHIVISLATVGQWLPIYLALFLYYKFTGSTLEKRRIQRNTRLEQLKEKIDIGSGNINKFIGKMIEFIGKITEQNRINYSRKLEQKKISDEKKKELNDSKKEEWRELFEKENRKQQEMSKPSTPTKPSGNGYKKGNFIGGQTYSLECSHQIRARKQTGLIGKGMIGKTVWCDVCNAYRVVTGSVWAQY
jgi:hypothetical protein